MAAKNRFAVVWLTLVTENDQIVEVLKNTPGFIESHPETTKGLISSVVDPFTDIVQC